ncbi:MAG: tRNA 4-thiouridine(8) synthase ThiI [Nitrospinota bacterium]|nr:tRNA 4-thiouridine(8) synthase ThiI [Nitrospinota bacterium]
MNDRRTILVRYDEIGLKGKNRDHFINRLVKNIQMLLIDLEGLEFRVPHGRIFIHCSKESADECILRLQKIPGIASSSVGVTRKPEFDALAAVGVEWIEPLLQPNKTFKFCVRTNRADKSYPYKSPEIDREVGSRILGQLHSQGLEVSIKDADFTLEIEIGQDETVVFYNRVPGLRGLPVGSSGDILGLISGGIDSPVALYRLMKRGCRAHGIFFDNRPFMGRGGYDKVLKLSKLLNRYQLNSRLFVVPFEDIQVAIRDNCRPAHRVVLYRRMMYRIAQAVARQKGCLALATGESVGQVASQTLENLNAVSQVVDLSVFRPLIGMNKQEIINEAKELGSYEISIEPHPDCCSVFMPARPATRAKIADLEVDETKFPWESLMQEAIEKMECVELDDLTV